MEKIAEVILDANPKSRSPIMAEERIKTPLSTRMVAGARLAGANRGRANRGRANRGHPLY
ncbi:MAG: hypothetical protein WC340_01185 [Kiritimatiellia bacterium]